MYIVYIYYIYYTILDILYTISIYCTVKQTTLHIYIAYLFSGMVLEGYTQGATYKDYKRAGVGIVFILFYHLFYRCSANPL